MTTADDYAWVREEARLEAFCFSAAGGRASLDDVLEGFEADPASETAATFDESFNGYPSPCYVLLGEAPGGILAAENNGWKGAQEGTLERASLAGRLVSYYRSVNADMIFALAERGAIVAAFDPLIDEVPSELTAAAGGLRFDPDHVTASAFALLERLSGVRLERAWLDVRHRRFALLSPA